MKVVFNNGPGRVVQGEAQRRLCDLLPGEKARVLEVNCDSRSRGRLLELGVLPGTELAFIRRAPLGDPLLVALRGYALSLGRADAEQITVCVEGAVNG